MKKPLEFGDEIRVIAPSTQWEKNRAKAYQRAVQLLEGIGYKVSFGDNLGPATQLDAVDARKRAQDLNDAFRDKNVKAILPIRGGWLVNSMLPFIDWDLVRSNPKPVIGWSDNTVLVNALYSMTGQINYLGPTLDIFYGDCEREYTIENMQNVLTQNQAEIKLKTSKVWGDGSSRNRFKSGKWTAIQSGEAQGIAIGGNLGSFYLLQGTEYSAAFSSSTILLAEDDAEVGKFAAREFDRRLESILQQTGARQNIKGILIGRFEKSSAVSMADIRQIIKSKNLKDIPVIANVDFGHTQPMLTLPIGGTIRMTAINNKVTIELVNY